MADLRQATLDVRVEQVRGDLEAIASEWAAERTRRVVHDRPHARLRRRGGAA
jgi:hypothetical protein